MMQSGIPLNRGELIEDARGVLRLERDHELPIRADRMHCRTRQARDEVRMLRLLALLAVARDAARRGDVAAIQRLVANA